MGTNKSVPHECVGLMDGAEDSRSVVEISEGGKSRRGD